MDIAKIHVHLSVHLHFLIICLERTCLVRNLISLFVVVVGALCSFVQPVSACSYDNVKESYLKLVGDAKEICTTDKYAAVCTSLKTAAMIGPPVLEAVPESLDEDQRKEVICRNNDKMSLWYQTQANLLRADLLVRSLNKFINKKNDELKKDVVPAKAQSNVDLLEIKLRDHVIGTIKDEIKKHLEGIPLNDADIHVLALQVCKKNIRPVTRSIVLFLFEKSDQLSKMCGILAGK